MSGKIYYVNASEDKFYSSLENVPYKEIKGNRRLHIDDSRGGQVDYDGTKVTYAGKREASFHASSHNLFETIAALDGNSKDLSERDLQLAKSLKGKFVDKQKFNKVVDVKSDTNGKTIFTIKNTAGTITHLTFDYETDEEKAVREASEKQKADATKKQESVKNPEAQPEEKSWLRKKLEEWFL